MKKELARTFQVPESLSVTKLEEEQGKIVLHCLSRRKKISCKHCGGETAGYDTRVIDKRHTLVGGKTVWLRISRRRLQCKKCRKVFNEPLEGIGLSELTDHMVQQIQEKAKGRDCSSVSREMGVCCATVCRKMWDLKFRGIKTPKKRSSTSA